MHFRADVSNNLALAESTAIVEFFDFRVLNIEDVSENGIGIGP